FLSGTRLRPRLIFILFCDIRAVAPRPLETGNTFRGGGRLDEQSDIVHLPASGNVTIAMVGEFAHFERHQTRPVERAESAGYLLFRIAVAALNVRVAASAAQRLAIAHRRVFYEYWHCRCCFLSGL